MNKHGTWAAIFLVAVVFLLSACSLGELAVCLAGQCKTNQEIASTIPWEPATLSLQNCPNISGKYRGASTKGVRLMQMFPQGTDIFMAIHVKIDSDDVKTSFKERADFRDNANAYIDQSNEELVVTQKDDAKGLYRRLTISLNSSMIGCDNGDIVIRQVFRSGGGEGISGGAMLATEKRYRKLADNSMQVIIHERNWRTNPGFGLTAASREGKSKATFLGAP
ncbi:MAG: hypothetical protein FWF31_11040 [Desulfobulbus sp.]|nr:hypothetical protein [Desulfobulbus sp.]